MYLEPAREIPVSGKYDIIVAGSGPAGFAAAINAARLGAKVLVLEMTGMIGGVSTSGLMSHFTGDADSKFYREILQRMSERNEECQDVSIYIDTEQLRELYLDMLNEEGIAYRLYSTVVDVMKDGNRVTGVIVQSKTVREAFEARIVIDATGDGDVSAMAGVPFTKGRESDGAMQPMTCMFKMGGVDFDRAVFPPTFETLVPTEKGELQSLAAQHLPKPAGHVLLFGSPRKGIVTANMTNCTNVDGTKAEDLTRAETVCQSQIPHIIRFLREYVPGYEHCYLISSASMIGVRETRHMEGVYQLTKEDILAKRVFPNWIVKGACFNFDVHNISGSGLDETGVQKKFPENVRYTIPYGCFVPKAIDGLLFTGRCISGTHIAHSNYRVMPICVAMGEGTGIAAALAIRHSIDVRDVDAKEVQAFL